MSIRKALPKDMLKAILAIYNDLDQSTEALTFRVDENENVQTYILCSDTFGYACADLHEITEENFELFLQTAEGLLAQSEEDEYAECDMEMVFIAIDRQARPIPPRVESLSKTARRYMEERLLVKTDQQ